MVNYTGLVYRNPFSEDTELRARAGARLLALREQLAHEIPPKSASDTLLIATWNVRDFGRDKFGHGWREPESYYYLAEIISAFDIVALQEIGGNPRIFRRLERLLGPNWEFMMTDLTEGSGGNGERMVFAYDKNRVWFRNIAGEVVLPESAEIGGFAKEVKLPKGSVLKIDGKEIEVKDGKAKLALPEGQKLVDRDQFARTPYLAAFQAGWFKFSLCSVHLYFGAASGAKLDKRIQEISSIGTFFKKRQAKERRDFGERGVENYILLGDFNIVSDDDDTMKALHETGFTMPEALAGKNTTMLKKNTYDQIAFRIRKRELETPEFDDFPNAGVFDFFKSVFRASEADGVPEKIAAADSDFQAYRDLMPKKQTDKLDGDEAKLRRYYGRTWRTWQMSDHLPVWVALKTDFADRYIQEEVIDAADDA